MNGEYSETDITWSSIERHYKYSEVDWHMGKNGIPIYTLIDKDGKKIEIKR